MNEGTAERAERWRLFVGIFPPPPIAEALGARIERWKGALRDKSFKWVPSEKLHLTLCFLGSVERSRVPELSALLSKVGAPQLSIELAGVGCFPNVRRPRVLWAGMKGDLSALATLQSKVSRLCAPFVQKPEDKPFSPHLTLARIKGPPPGHALRRLLEAESSHAFGHWHALEFRLMRSELGEGSRYEVVKSFGLG